MSTCNKVNTSDSFDLAHVVSSTKPSVPLQSRHMSFLFVIDGIQISLFHIPRRCIVPVKSNTMFSFSYNFRELDSAGHYFETENVVL